MSTRSVVLVVMLTNSLTGVETFSSRRTGGSSCSKELSQSASSAACFFFLLTDFFYTHEELALFFIMLSLRGAFVETELFAFLNILPCGLDVLLFFQLVFLLLSLMPLSINCATCNFPRIIHLLH